MYTNNEKYHQMNNLSGSFLSLLPFQLLLFFIFLWDLLLRSPQSTNLMAKIGKDTNCRWVMMFSSWGGKNAKVNNDPALSLSTDCELFRLKKVPATDTWQHKCQVCLQTVSITDYRSIQQMWTGVGRGRGGGRNPTVHVCLYNTCLSHSLLWLK